MRVTIYLTTTVKRRRKRIAALKQKSFNDLPKALAFIAANVKHIASVTVDARPDDWKDFLMRGKTPWDKWLAGDRPEFPNAKLDRDYLERVAKMFRVPAGLLDQPIAEADKTVASQMITPQMIKEATADFEGWIADGNTFVWKNKG